MTDHLKIHGRLIGHTTLDRRPMYYDPADELYVFHQLGEGFTVLTLARAERHDDTGAVTSAHASASTSSFGTVEALADALVDRYGDTGWNDILKALDPSADPELYRRWAVARIDADFNDASLHVKDLALATGLLADAGGVMPAPGRAIGGWEDHYLRLMGDHLAGRGFEVLGPAQLDMPPEANAFGDPVLGALVVDRYGHEAVGVVRVDVAGEVFIRLHRDDNEVPAVSPAPDEDDW